MKPNHADSSDEEDEEEEEEPPPGQRRRHLIERVDHSKIDYLKIRLFFFIFFLLCCFCYFFLNPPPPKKNRKNFYVEVREIADMTPEDVIDRRHELDEIKVKGKRCPNPVRFFHQVFIFKCNRYIY